VDGWVRKLSIRACLWDRPRDRLVPLNSRSEGDRLGRLDFLALPAIESSISACSLMRFRPFAGRADAAGSCAMLRRSASMVTVDACACSSARIREQRAGKTLIHFNLCPYAVDPFLQHRNRESLAVARRDGFLFMA
jgi:hypothetical protein